MACHTHCDPQIAIRDGHVGAEHFLNDYPLPRTAETPAEIDILAHPEADRDPAGMRANARCRRLRPHRRTIFAGTSACECRRLCQIAKP